MKFTRTLAATLALALLVPCAWAEGLSLSGMVTTARTAEVYAPIGGTVASLDAEIGQSVRAGDPLATLETQKVYAGESGTVTGIFAQPGDDAETVSNRYGAVMYIEGEAVYTIAASTENAYNATSNRFVHVGEEVYLNCYSDGGHTGTGVVTAVEGTDFTVETRSGKFLVGETVSVYRGSSAVASQRIGRGTLSRKSPTPVTGQGGIVSIAVADGDEVQRGDLLFETLSGSFDGLYMSGNQILATEDGVLAQLNLQQGGQIEKDAVAAVIYPADAMCIEAEVYESDLALIAEGDPVEIELVWNQDDEVRYPGTVTGISALATAASNSNEGGGAGEVAEAETSYTVTIAFTPDEHTRYGMTAVVMTREEFEEEEAAEEDSVEEPDDEAAELAEDSEAEFAERAGGEFPREFNGEFPEGFDGEFPADGFEGRAHGDCSRSADDAQEVESDE